MTVKMHLHCKLCKPIISVISKEQLLKITLKFLL
jgi:hypothetical protein